MRCSDCNETITKGEQTAHGPDGEVHYHCFKRGTAHGKSIDIMEAFDEIGRLKKRVQDLERTSEDHANELRHHSDNIPFRIGGGG